MPRTREQLEELRNQKIALIERTAMRCFAEKGFHNTSISTIAKEAGISAGLTYNYFSSKDELLKSIYIKGIQKVYAPLASRKELTKETFLAFIENIFSEIQANIPFWRLYFMVMSQPEIMNQFQAYMVETASPIIEAIVHYFHSLGADQPQIEAYYLFATLDGVCLNFLLNDQEYPLTQLKQKLLKYYA